MVVGRHPQKRRTISMTKTRTNIFAGVMINAQRGLKAGHYRDISSALKSEHAKAKRLYGNR